MTTFRPHDYDEDPLAWLKREKAALRQKRYRDNHPDYFKEYRAEYRKSHARTDSRRGIMDKPRTGGHFVAIDSEGMNIGSKFYLDKTGTGERTYITEDEYKALLKRQARHSWNKDIYQDQRTCLWMAGGVQGVPDRQMTKLGGFTSEKIMSWLLDLPRHFDQAIKVYTGARSVEHMPIFVAFGFGYDVGQIVKDLPFEKRWELHNGKPWSQRHNANFISDLRAYPILYKEYALYYIPGKMITLFRLKDQNKPWYRRTDKDGKQHRELDWKDRICIYDTFGFFQQPFVTALGGFPDALSQEEFEIVKNNKAKRGKFTEGDIEEIKIYTSLELKGLVNIMNTIRTALREAISGHRIELKEWYGAGAIARASLESYLKSEARAHLGDMENDALWKDENSPNNWVLHAYFGARIDLVKQGYHVGSLYEYDIASAYPSIATNLPSMKDGTWELIENPTREQVFASSPLSMFEVATINYSADLPFYALPYRTPSHSIMFPMHVWGYYMRDHVIAAYKHFDAFSEAGRLADYSINRGPPKIEVRRAWLFHPATDNKPLSWIKELFDYRAGLDKKDARGQVIKLNINAVYGKFAQRIGRRGNPPKFGSLWYAAAITAGTQRQLIEAALTKPDAIVAFATDGIYTVEPLDIRICPPKQKILGEWEMTKGEKGSFIQSGVYAVHLNEKEGKVQIKVKSRGFTPTNTEKREGETYNDVLNRTMIETIPELWNNGEEGYSFPYQQYMTVGLSVQHRKFSDLIGMWRIAPRELQLDSISNKRVVPGQLKIDAAKRAKKGEATPALSKKELKLRADRAKKLIPLQAKHWLGPMPLSEKSVPEWLDERTKLERMEDQEYENVVAGLS